MFLLPPAPYLFMYPDCLDFKPEVRSSIFLEHMCPFFLPLPISLCILTVMPLVITKINKCLVLEILSSIHKYSSFISYFWIRESLDQTTNRYSKHALNYLRHVYLLRNWQSLDSFYQLNLLVHFINSSKKKNI